METSDPHSSGVYDRRDDVNSLKNASTRLRRSDDHQTVAEVVSANGRGLDAVKATQLVTTPAGSN
jgi:hypothetical protein